MITKKNCLLLTCSLLILSGCETIPVVSQLPAKPMDLMQPCQEESFLNEMEAALDGAQGLKEDWLIDYAAEAEECRLKSQGLQSFINKTWETR